MRLCLGQLRIRFAHFPNQRPDELVEEQVVGTEFLAVANSPANDTAEHVAPTLVISRER